MSNMNYELLAKKYQPKKINTLLIGEAPPPNGKKYFYLIPENYRLSSKTIEDDCSLPSTIFNHYFGRRPFDSEEYEHFLNQLKERGVFLIDIIEEPIQIRDRQKRGLNEENLNRLFSEENLKRLKTKVDSLISTETNLIFLYARGYKKEYRDRLKRIFENSISFRWKDFRLNTTEKYII